ncbi:MAG: WD40/YVTN/BNR-like repeat-containing protein [Promethearchaeota archaeon]
MNGGVIRCLKNKRTVILGSFLLLIWGILSFVVMYFQVPFALYLEFTDNPWQPISSETYPETGVATIDFVDSYHGWIAGENGTIMATTDGSKSWEEQRSGVNSSINGIDFFNTAIGAAISEKDDILITQNGGVTWTLLERVKNPNNASDITLWDVVTCDERTALVLGTMGTFFRIDIPNLNWIYISKIAIHLHCLTMLNCSHGWATGGYSAIVRTVDGWQTFEIQNTSVSKDFYGIFFWDVHKGWIVGFDNTIIATTDSGQHWYVQYEYHSLLPCFGFIGLLDIFFITELNG